MMSHPEACTILTQMEVRLHETRHNLYDLERSLRDRAETQTIDSHPKMRRYNRRMCNWSRKDEQTYLRMLDRLTDSAAAIWTGCGARSSVRMRRSKRCPENIGSMPGVPSSPPL